MAKMSRVTLCLLLCSFAWQARCTLNSSQNLSDFVCSSSHRPKYHSIFNDEVRCYYPNGNSPPVVLVNPVHCLTYDLASEQIVVGLCILPLRTKPQHLYPNTTLADVHNGSTCSDNNEDDGGYNGTSCGKCNSVSRPAINTFGLVCLPKPSCGHINWLTYFVVKLIPLTVFYCVVLVFRIRVTGGSANLFVLYAQALTLPMNVVLLKRDWLAVTSTTHTSDIMTGFVSVLYGIWNLDFLRGVLPDMCIKSNLSMIQLLTLDYITAVYPLFLIGFTYLLIELHARNFRIIVQCWKPFNSILARFKMTHPNGRRSVVDAFSTFVLLSYAKFAHTSLAILTPTPLYNMSSHEVAKVALYDGTMRYFQPPHCYYAIAAIAVLIVFVIPPPLLLLLYPMKWFQRFLDVCRLRNNLLTAFTDAFQGCYKDGLNGTKDCRYFAGLYFLVRVVIFGLYAFVTKYNLLYLSLHMTVGCLAALIAIFMPYKNNFYNKLDLLLSGLYILITSAAVYNNWLITKYQDNIAFMIFFYILLMVPIIYVSIYGSFWLVVRIHVRYGSRRYILRDRPHSTQQRLISFFESSDTYYLDNSSLTTPLNELSDNPTLLPDRLVHPDEYHHEVQ